MKTYYTRLAGDQPPPEDPAPEALTPAPRYYRSESLLGGLGAKITNYTPYTMPRAVYDKEIKRFEAAAKHIAERIAKEPDKTKRESMEDFNKWSDALKLLRLRGGYLPENWMSPKDSAHGWDVSNTAQQWLNPVTRDKMEKITKELRDTLRPYAKSVGSRNPFRFLRPSSAEVFQRLNEHVVTPDFNPAASRWDQLPYHKMVMLQQQIQDAKDNAGYLNLSWLPQPKRMELFSPEWYRQYEYARALESTDPKKPQLRSSDRKQWKDLNPHLHPSWEKFPGGNLIAQLIQYWNPKAFPEYFEPVEKTEE